MTVSALKDEMGIEGDVAWLLEAAEFPDLLSQVYRAHFGEIWLFNNDLQMILDEKYFPTLYLEKISQTLRERVLSVKILVSKNAEVYLVDEEGNPSIELQRQARRIKRAGGLRRLETIYFGKASEAKVRFEALAQIPDSHSWVFYAHRKDIRSPNHGVVIVRPNEFPFRDERRDSHYAIAWQMQRAHLLRKKLQETFSRCFDCEGLFSYISLGPKSKCSWAKNWSRTSKELATQYDTPDTHDPLALGEKAGAVVLASRFDEFNVLQRLINEELGARLSPVPAPVGHGTCACANIPTTSGRLKVLFAEVGEGLITAGIRTAEILARWRPTHVILCGVAGADPNAEKVLGIGDVVIGESIINYEEGNITEVPKSHSDAESTTEQTSGEWFFIPRHQRNSWDGNGTDLFKSADALCKSWSFTKENLASLGVDTKDIAVEGPFKARSTVIGSGSKVVEAAKYFVDVLKAVNRKIDTVETEAFGVCRACVLAHPPKNVLVVKGIMDYADGKSRDGEVRPVGRNIAGASCSHFVFRLLQRLEAEK